MSNIIDGKLIANEIKSELRNKLKNKNVVVASILVGNDSGSIFYLNNQEKVAKDIGINFKRIHLESSNEEELIGLIEELNEDESIKGIIIQLPLPKNINQKNIISKISPKKDIDCLTYENQGKLYMGENNFIPCTPNSVLTILKSLNISLEGKHAVVIGRSNIVGKPLANLLLKENMTVTICHSKSSNIKDICKDADILVSAVGKPKFINDEYVKDGAILIDVGTSSLDGKITGDFDFENVKDKTQYITKVPGGVGAITTTLLFKNVCRDLI